MKKNKEKGMDSCHTIGSCLATKVDVEINEWKSKDKKKYWFCCACVGEEYYETDSYREKDYAISEMIGYLEGLNEFIDKEIKNLKEMLK